MGVYVQVRTDGCRHCAFEAPSRRLRLSAGITTPVRVYSATTAWRLPAQDLAELVVSSSQDLVRLLEQGQRVRHVAATAMNERSSRSHSCFTIKVGEADATRSVGERRWSACRRARR